MLPFPFVQAKEFVKNFTQTTAEDRERKVRSKTGTPKDFDLACKCPLKRSPAVVACKQGRSIEIRNGYWAGNLDNNNVPEPHQVTEKKAMSRKEFDKLWAGVQAKGGRGLVTGRFAAVKCDNGKCHIDSGNLTWDLTKESPCLSGIETTGPLCGLCQEGRTQMLGLTVSFDGSIAKGWRSVTVGRRTC